MILDTQTILAGITGGFLGGIGFWLSEKLCKFIYKRIKEHAVKVKLTKEVVVFGAV